MLNTMNQIVPGSIADVAKTTGKSIAQTFMHAKVVTIVDVSGSMGTLDSTGGQSRYSVACKELAFIQKQNPGKVAVIAFSDNSEFCPGGVPFFEGGGTDLAGALRYAKIADIPGMNIIVISDGEPNKPDTALEVARTYKNKISVIYVGPEQRPYGRDFLHKLANVTGGQTITADTARELSNTTAIGFKLLDPGGRTTFVGFKRHYHNLVDQAVADISTGNESWSGALRNALKQTADSGIRVLDYESGYSRRLDSAMRQNVLDGVKAITTEISARNGEKFGADGWEIEAHNWCAPDHLPFQGRRYTKKQFEDIQASLKRKFETWNCRHTVYAVDLEASTPLYTEEELQKIAATSTEVREFEGREYTAYEATQLQRKIETRVRLHKDRANIAKAAGDDLTRRAEQLRINQLKDKYVELSNAFGLPVAKDRMAAAGFRRVKAISPKVLPVPNTTLKQNVTYLFVGLNGKIEQGLVPYDVELATVKVIAGYGSSMPIRDVDRLVATYGGNAKDWQKKTGFAYGKSYCYLGSGI